MDSAVVTGLFTLGGVAVGGLATGAANYGLSRRLERREAHAAARLLLEEATQIRYALEAILDQATWRPLDFVGTTQWDQNQALLAHHLRWIDWRCVVAAYEDLSRLLGWVRANSVPGDLNDSDVPVVRHNFDRFDHAVQNHLIQLAVHGPQPRRLAETYWRLRTRLRQTPQQPSQPQPHASPS